MALRLIEAFLPPGSGSTIQNLFNPQHILGVWHETVSEDRVLVRVLVDSDLTDTVLNKIEEAYGGTEGYRIMILSVEAALPRPKPPAATLDTPKGPAEEPPTKTKARISVEELYADVGDMIRGGRIFHVMVALSTIVAAVGLARSNVAVIIGAMVIAPLLGPNVSLSLAATMGDLRLALRSIRINLSGVALALALAFAIGWTFDIDASAHEILSRTRVDMADIAVALAAGTAGALSITRGVASALVGVMVAVALLPPLVVVGLLLGMGEYTLAYHATLLLMINIVGVNLSGVTTFLAQGVHPHLTWAKGRARWTTVAALLVWSLVMAAFGFLVWWTGAAT